MPANLYMLLIAAAYLFMSFKNVTLVENNLNNDTEKGEYLEKQPH